MQNQEQWSYWRHAPPGDGNVPVDWESFLLLSGRRLRWRRLGPLIRSTKLIDLQTGELVVSLRSKRSIRVGFRAGLRTYVIESADDGYRLADEETGNSIFTVQGGHFRFDAQTRVSLPSGTTVTLPVSGRTRRRAVLHAVASEGSILFYLRWRWGSLWAGVAGLEVAVPPGQVLTAELLGLIYLSSTSLLANFFAGRHQGAPLG